MPKVIFIDGNASRREVEAQSGLSILEVARQHEVDIEGRCEGSLACATCHVIVDSVRFELLGPMTEDEQDMLDLAFNVRRTSRLGCQIIISEALDGIEVTLPHAD